VKRSVCEDHLVCLEDGLKLRSLKQHLRVQHGLTPQQYRAKWGLPDDYPMAAPSYAKARSNLAKSMGLSQYRKGAVKAG
jgi:predicted transcriptional regulator